MSLTLITSSLQRKSILSSNEQIFRSVSSLIAVKSVAIDGALEGGIDESRLWLVWPMALKRRNIYGRPLCGERGQISSEPYTEHQKQSPSLHIRKVRIDLLWNLLPAKWEISEAGHHQQFPHHRPFPFQIQTIRSRELTLTTIHFFSSIM